MKEKVIRIFEQMIRPLKNRVLLMIGRGILTAIDTDKEIQLCSVNLLADEVKDKTEVFQHYGFTSAIPSDTEIIMLSVGGNRDHGIVIGSENRSLRLKGLSEGDSAIYNKKEKYLWLNEDNLRGLVEKIVINNTDHEFLDVLVETLEMLRDSFNRTAVGPLPKDEASITAINESLDKLKTFKE